MFEEFVAIKDSLSRCKLPADLKFGPNINGIRNEDKGTYRVVKNVASYCETNLKILSLMQSDEYRSKQGAINDLIVSNTALMKSLKEEHATLMVQGKFNKDTAFMYKALGSDSNSFTPNSLERLQLAANLTQYNRRTDSDQRGRGRGRFNFRGRYRGSRDAFSRFTQQDFPRQARQDTEDMA